MIFFACLPLLPLLVTALVVGFKPFLLIYDVCFLLDEAAFLLEFGRLVLSVGRMGFRLVLLEVLVSFETECEFVSDTICYVWEVRCGLSSEADFRSFFSLS